jgi:hypothetical protein
VAFGGVQASGQGNRGRGLASSLAPTHLRQMNRQRQGPTATLGLATALAALAACGGADRTVAPGQPVATDTVHVSPDSLALDLSGVDSLTARLVDTTGAPVEGTVEWTVRDTTKVRRIVTMALTAPILPFAPGTTYIVASVPDGVSDSAKVVVTADATPPPPPPPSGTQTLYVTPTGSGTACAAAAPCALSLALTLTADTIMVGAGAYPATTISRSGRRPDRWSSGPCRVSGPPSPAC